MTVERLVEAGLGQQQIADSLATLRFDSALVVVAAPAADASYSLSVEMRQVRDKRTAQIAGPIVVHALRGLSADSVTTLVRLLTAQAALHLGLTTARGSVSESQNVAAQMMWFKGNDAYGRRTPESIRAAIAFYETAIQFDSSFAPAYASLAQTFALTLFYHYRTHDDPFHTAVRILRLTERAAALQPSLAESYTARGYLGAIAGAPREYVHENYERARKLNPVNPNSRTWYLSLLFADGKVSEALDSLEEQARRDPLSPAVRISVALYSLSAGHYPNAVRNAAKAREMQPGIPFTSALELWARLLQGGNELRECLSLVAGPYLGARALCVERTLGGAAARVFADSLGRLATTGKGADTTFDPSIYGVELAAYYAARGDSLQARQWLAETYRASPIGVDPRILKTSIFSPALQALGDSLHGVAWRRLRDAAARPDSLPR